jgi:hypothetical protein
MGSDGVDTADNGGASAARAATGATFTEGNLDEKVQDLLAQPSPGPRIKEGNGESMGAASEGGNLPKRAENPLPPCIREGIGRTDTPLAMESGTYQGTGVYLVVLPHRSQVSRVDAYIVDAACIDAATAVKADVLLTRTYTRG